MKSLVANQKSRDRDTNDFSIARTIVSSGTVIILRENSFTARPFHRGGDGDEDGEKYLIFDIYDRRYEKARSDKTTGSLNSERYWPTP
ncbi:uncharacterized protein Bfra_005116 [Botrytis fragariae]|uniref:Uncharacterized protein n=1 Tax=Botrytis fragariae TaxID=1964551 RepID=A0A8H6AU31_9HELO|nr:uncharacterized protein Bfra_005116 [Botrytis fragariae]KAF5873652.1 hypothetical protein Bfra_005116 [Botrytis fragariae]